MQESVISRGVNSEERDQFIPIRKSDIIAGLTKSGLLVGCDQHEKFRQLCRLLGAIFHYEYFERLETLRDDYYYFNPEIRTGPKARSSSRSSRRAWSCSKSLRRCSRCELRGSAAQRN